MAVRPSIMSQRLEKWYTVNRSIEGSRKQGIGNAFEDLSSHHLVTLQSLDKNNNTLSVSFFKKNDVLFVKLYDANGKLISRFEQKNTMCTFEDMSLSFLQLSVKKRNYLISRLLDCQVEVNKKML